MKHCFLAIFSLLALPLLAVKPVAEYNFDSPLPAAMTKGKISYVPGIRGKAVQLGNSTVTIPCPKGVTPHEGTISMWIKPVNWDSTKKEFVFFVQNVNAKKNGRIILYKYSDSGLGTTFWFGNPQGAKSRDNCYASTRKKDDLKQGEWALLSATWSKKNHLIRLYINGAEVASYECKDQMFFDEFGKFVLNPQPFRPFNRNYETAFDLVRIYNRVLTEKELMKIYETESKPVLEIPLSAAHKSFITVPKMKVLPKIDGNFTDSEWAGAAKLGGFIELRNPRWQSDPDTEAYMGSDGKRLYFCFVGKIPGATKIVCNKTERDSDVYADDAYEIYLRTPQMDKGFYQGIFNYNGAIFDTLNSEKKWNGKWEIKNGIYEGHWICEIAIDLSELKAAFKENALWDFNICRDRQLGSDISFSSVSPSGMPFRAHFAKLRTSATGAFGRLTVNYERLFERKLDFDLEIINQSNAAKNVDLEVLFLDHEGNQLSKKQFSAAIKGNAAHNFKVSDPLTGFRAGIIRMTARSGSELIYKQDMPLVFKDEITISDETDLAKNTLAFEIDLKSHYRITSAASVKAILKDKTGKTVQVNAPASGAVAKGVFDLKPLTVGDCTVTYTFIGKNGEELFTHSVYYNHIGQPRWLKEKPGTNAGVLYPYTPIKFDGKKLSVIGRDHTFGTTLLPEQITSRNIALFSAKPVLKAVVDGKETVIDNFVFTTVKKADDAVTLKFTAGRGKLKLSGTVFIEFDGLLWYTLDIARTPGTIQSLTLDIEMPPEVAEFYNGHFFSRENYVGKIKCPMNVRRIPSLWVGNPDVGLTLAVESFQHWNNADQLKAFEFFKRGKNTVWQIRFIDRKTDLAKKALKFEFGFEANPVKPIPEDFRSWRVHAHRPSNICHPSQVSREIRKYPGYNGGFTPEFKSLEAFKAEVKRFRDTGSEMSLYINPTLTSPDTTEYKIFRQQWRNPHNVYPQCPASTLADLTISQIDYLIREGGLQIVYVDSLGAVNCANGLHGCGYLDENGVSQLTWPIRATREYMKRLYALIHTPGSDPSNHFLWAHMSARTSAPINAFVDFQCSGEELETVIAGNQNYLELYDLDAYQCYYLNSAGVMPMLLPNLGRVGSPKSRWMPKYNDQIMALVLLHDTMLWVCWCDTNYILKFYQILDEFGYKDKNLKFHSYRKQQMITSDEKEVYTSIYQLGGKSLAVIVNKINSPRRIKVKLDYEKLGIKPGCMIIDTRSGKTLSASGNELTLDIPGYNFALIQIGD